MTIEETVEHILDVAMNYGEPERRLCIREIILKIQQEHMIGTKLTVHFLMLVGCLSKILLLNI